MLGGKWTKWMKCGGRLKLEDAEQGLKHAVGIPGVNLSVSFTILLGSTLTQLDGSSCCNPLPGFFPV